MKKFIIILLLAIGLFGCELPCWDMDKLRSDSLDAERIYDNYNEGIVTIEIEIDWGD